MLSLENKIKLHVQETIHDIRTPLATVKLGINLVLDSLAIKKEGKPILSTLKSSTEELQEALLLLQNATLEIDKINSKLDKLSSTMQTKK